MAFCLYKKALKKRREMEKIFGKPLILNGKEDNVVLIYSKYIIANISKEIADLCVEKIDENDFRLSYFETIIKINEIVKYKFRPGNDSFIKFGVHNITGSHKVNIEFKDHQTAKQAEIAFMKQFDQLGFKRKELQIKAINAAILPIIFMVIITIVGNLFAWLAFKFKDLELTQDKITDEYTYLFEEKLGAVGGNLILVITVLLLVICFFWILQKVSNLSYKITAYK